MILDPNPDNWEFQKFYAVHKPTGEAIWIANGVFHLHFSRGGEYLMPWRKIKLWRELNKIRENQIRSNMGTLGEDK